MEYIHKYSVRKPNILQNGRFLNYACSPNTGSSNDLFNGNGAFTSYSWITKSSYITMSVSGGALSISSTSAYKTAYADCINSAIPGNVYYLTFDFYAQNSGQCSFYIGTSADNDKYIKFTNMVNSTWTTYALYFYCEDPTIRMTIYNPGTAVQASHFRSFYVYSVKNTNPSKSYTYYRSSSNYTTFSSDKYQYDSYEDNNSLYSPNTLTIPNSYPSANQYFTSLHGDECRNVISSYNSKIDSRLMQVFRTFNLLKNCDNSLSSSISKALVKSSSSDIAISTGLSSIIKTTTKSSNNNFEKLTSTSSNSAVIYVFPKTNFVNQLSRSNFQPLITTSGVFEYSIKNYALEQCYDDYDPGIIFDTRKSQEFTKLETPISMIDPNGWSTLSSVAYCGYVKSSYTTDTTTTLYLRGLNLPRETKSILLTTKISSTNSLTAENYIAFKTPVSSVFQYINSISGRKNTYSKMITQWIDLYDNQKIDFSVKTTGTLTISICKIYAIKVS